MFVIILTAITAAILVAIYEKTDSLSLREFVALLAGTVFLGAFTLIVVSIQASSDEKMVTGTVVGKYYREEYCYERDHRDPYDCNCSTSSDGTESCDTCYREYTTTHNEDESWTLVYGTRFSGFTGSYVKEFSTRGDRLCSFQKEPEQRGFGTDEGVRTKDVSEAYYGTVSLGDVRSWTQWYRNPVKPSNVVINDGTENAAVSELREKAFGTDRNDVAKRVISEFPVSETDLSAVEKFNYDFNGTGISLVVVITKEGPEFAHTVRRKFKNGKSNEFIVVVSTQDGKTLSDASVVTWNNERMVTDVEFDLNAKKGSDFSVSEVVGTVSKYAGTFKEKDFSEYGYLETEIPTGVLVFAFVLDAAIIAFAAYHLMGNFETKSGDPASWSSWIAERRRRLMGGSDEDDYRNYR